MYCNKMNILDILQTEKIEMAQVMKSPEITKSQIQNLNNETTDKHKPKFQNMREQFDKNKTGRMLQIL